MWLLVLATSAFFGVAHVLSGAWEVGKAITATVAGVVLGACFIYYGLYASILLHWYFNYHLQVWVVWPELTGSIGVLLMVGLILLVELAVGALSLIMFLVQGMRMLVGRKPSPPPQAPYYIAGPPYRGAPWALRGVSSHQGGIKKELRAG